MGKHKVIILYSSIFILIPVYKNIEVKRSFRSSFHEEYFQISTSVSSENLCCLI